MNIDHGTPQVNPDDPLSGSESDRRDAKFLKGIMAAANQIALAQQIGPQRTKSVFDGTDANQFGKWEIGEGRRGRTTDTD